MIRHDAAYQILKHYINDAPQPRPHEVTAVLQLALRLIKK